MKTKYTLVYKATNLTVKQYGSLLGKSISSIKQIAPTNRAVIGSKKTEG